MAQSYLKWCKEEKCGKSGNVQEHVSHKLLSQFLSKLVCRVVCIESIKYVKPTKIGRLVIEIRGIENGQLAVPVNIILIHHTAFLATDTQLSTLICRNFWGSYICKFKFRGCHNFNILVILFLRITKPSKIHGFCDCSLSSMHMWHHHTRNPGLIIKISLGYSQLNTVHYWSHNRMD